MNALEKGLRQKSKALKKSSASAIDRNEGQLE